VVAVFEQHQAQMPSFVIARESGQSSIRRSRHAIAWT